MAFGQNPTFFLTPQDTPPPNCGMEELAKNGATRKFDLHFLQRLTYEFAPEYARLMGRRQANSSKAKIQALGGARRQGGVIPWQREI